MPVVVVNAGGALGHAVAWALLQLGAEIEVRATVSDAGQRPWFLDRGVPVAVTELDDADLLAVIFSRAHTVVLLDADPSPAGPDSERGSSDVVLHAVLAAMAEAGVPRLIAAGTWATEAAPLAGPVRGAANGADSLDGAVAADGVATVSPASDATLLALVEVLLVTTMVSGGGPSGVDAAAAEIVALDSRGSAR